MSFFTQPLSPWCADVLCVQHPFGVVSTGFVVGLGAFHSQEVECNINVFINDEMIPCLRMTSTKDGGCAFVYAGHRDVSEDGDGDEIFTLTSDPKLKKEVVQGTLSPRILAALPMIEGQNLLRYEIEHGKSKKVLNAFIYLWSSEDSVVICDIDGTITKSDNRGHVMTALGLRYEHAGVCELLGRLSDIYRIIYLTGRPASSLESTREYISKLCQKGHRLPMGPMFTTKTGLLGSVISELAGESASFKTNVLLYIQQLFVPKVRALEKVQSRRTSISPEEFESKNESGANTPLTQPMTRIESADVKIETDYALPECYYSPIPVEEEMKYEKVTAASAVPTARDVERIFVAGFGNSLHDKEAYESVGILKSRVFMIDKDSNIRMGEDLEAKTGKAAARAPRVFESYSGMMSALDELFPKLKEDNWKTRVFSSSFSKRTFQHNIVISSAPTTPL